MVFSSNIFLLFFLPCFLLAYFLVPRRFRNAVLLAFSVVFYAFGAPDFVLILIAACVANFLIVRKMDKTDALKGRKILCALSVILSLSLLLYFKYANFIVENVNILLKIANLSPFNFRKVALPIGISFFTFQSITYAVDVYRKQVSSSSSFSGYLLYIMMFPQLIAGPIVRYNSVAEQIMSRESAMEDRVRGICRFCIGLGKKVLISNVLATVVDNAFSLPAAQLSTLDAWIGSLAYTFQIYFDFSGYSDMAIGLGMIMGFRFPENFMNPYISQNISEFWRRWHITLGSFMREYLYIPLGGNRISKPRTYANLIIVFLCSGIWHGASWNFLFWGLYHGFFIVLDKLFLVKFLKKIGRIPAVIITFVTVNIGFVVFRADDVPSALGFYKAMFTHSPGHMLSCSPEFRTIFIIAAVFSFICISKKGEIVQRMIFGRQYSKRGMIAMFVISAIIFILSVGSLTATDFNPFIYFRF